MGYPVLYKLWDTLLNELWYTLCYINYGTITLIMGQSVLY